MNRIWKFASAVGIASAATALCTLPANAVTPNHTHHASANRDGSVFVQNDAVGGNAIVAYNRSDSGGLVQAGTYPTGGKGGVLSGSAVDHLASEGSLTYDKSARLLYAVNAGSNTVTSFAVNGDHLTRRQVLTSGGQFPVSIAVHGNLVYVLNARDGGSISGYLQFAGILVPIPAWHRDLHLDTSAPGQTDEFTSTPGQIGFTPNGATLLISTKNGGNSIDAYALSLFGPALRPVVTSLPGTVPFGFTFDYRGHLVLTEAGPNAVASFAVGRAGRLVQLDSAATGQAGTCWIVGTRGTFYASNAGSGTLSLYRTSVRGVLTGRGTASTDAGTVDAAASSDGRYLYVQTGGAGIIDAYRINPDGSLTQTGTVTAPGAIGAEGIAAL